MKIKKILVSVVFLSLLSLFFVIPVNSTGPVEPNVTIQKRIQNAKHSKCDRKMDYYGRMVQQYPDSSYYRWLLRKWEKRCTVR